MFQMTGRKSPKRRAKPTFRPEVSSAEEYAECGLLEEGVHTYLLFERKNKEFSNGLYLEERMKWRVEATVFWRRGQIWTERIADGETTPPLI